MTDVAEHVARIRAKWSEVGALQAEARGLEARLRKARAPEREKVEEPLARMLVEAGHEIQRQTVCGAGRIDIFDGTTSEIIECKARGSASLISDAVNQLNRYRPHFFDPQLAIAVPFVEDDARWMIAALAEIGIRIIEIEKGGPGV
jgi:Holliday junction resolvase